jgi:hypothetical protein
MLNHIICNAIVLAPTAYFAIAFAVHLAHCWQRTASTAAVTEPQSIEPDIKSDAELLAAWDEAFAATSPDALPAPAAEWNRIVTFTRRQPQVAWWRSLNAQQLRPVCKRNGIEWRNATSEGKHLSKSQMLSALDLLPQVV